MSSNIDKQEHDELQELAEKHLKGRSADQYIVLRSELEDTGDTLNMFILPSLSVSDLIDQGWW